MFKKITLATAAVLFACATGIHAQPQAPAANQMQMAEAAGTVAGTATVCQERSPDWLSKVTFAFGILHRDLIQYFNAGVSLAYSLPATPLECGCNESWAADARRTCPEALIPRSPMMTRD